MKNDIELYIFEAKQKNIENKKISVLEQHKEIIQKMYAENLTMTQIYSFLVAKYKIKSSYENLRKYIKRNVINEVVETKTSTKIDDGVKPFSAARQAYNSYKPLD